LKENLKKSVMKKAAVTLVACMIATGMIMAQQGDTLVQYTPDFKFRDGIYMGRRKEDFWGMGDGIFDGIGNLVLRFVNVS